MNTNDPECVKYVQQALIDLGWLDGGPPDGILGDKLKDEILAFRRRASLPLADASGAPLYIDSDFLKALRTAPNKALPIEQVSATVDDIAPKVEAVAANNASISVNWWTRFTAFIAGIPATVLSILVLALQNTDSALAMIAPIRAAFSEVPFWVWLGMFGIICIILGIQAHIAKAQSDKAEKAMVAGYQIGTLKNDPPAMKDAS